MNRWLRRGLIGLALLAAAGLALWYRPALQAGLVKVRDYVQPAEPAAEAAPAAEPEATASVVAGTVDDGWCGLHRRPERDCPECDRGEKRSDGCRERLPIVRLKSAEVARKVGIATAEVSRWRHAHYVEGNAEIAYAGHDDAHILPRVPGRIVEVPTDEGQKVKKGQVLVVVDSAEVGTAKANYLAALPMLEVARTAHDRITNLVKKNAAAVKDEIEALGALNKARADVLNARQRLLNFGFTEADLKQIEHDHDTSSLLKCTAPMDGTLVERSAVVGEAVEPTTVLYELTNLNHLWCWIDVYEADVDRIAIGQPVEFTISGTEEPVFRGPVDLIGFAVNPATRTVRVRAELANPAGRLRANQFGRARIRVEPEHDTLIVPKVAVQHDDKADLVFLPRPDGRTFVPKRVVARPVEAPDRVEVAWGLEPGQEVVTTGSFLLKSEMLRDRIAGD